MSDLRRLLEQMLPADIAQKRSSTGGSSGVATKVKQHDTWPPEGYGETEYAADDPTSWMAVGLDPDGRDEQEGNGDAEPLGPRHRAKSNNKLDVFAKEGKMTSPLLALIREAISLVESEESDREQAEELASTPEYASVDAFAEFAIDDDRLTFTHVDLQALCMVLREPTQKVRAQLEAYGLKLASREPVKRTRGFTTSSNDRWYGPGSLATHGGAGIDTSTGRATVRGKTV